MAMTEDALTTVPVNETPADPVAAVRAWLERAQKRKPKKAAIVAAARKLAEAIWRLFALGEAFDLTRAFGQPPAEAAA